MENKKIVGGTGITAGRDVVLGDIDGQIVIGNNITQVRAIDRKREKLEGYLTEHSKKLIEGPIKNWSCDRSRSMSPEDIDEMIRPIFATYRPRAKSEIIDKQESSQYAEFIPDYANLVIEHLKSGYTNNVDTWLECKNIIKSYLEKKFTIFEVIEEKLISKIPEDFKEYNDKIEKKGSWYLLPHSVREIYTTIQHFIISGKLYKLIIDQDSDLFIIRFENSLFIAKTPDKNSAIIFKEIVDEIITSGNLIEQIKLCMDEDERRKEKTNQFFQEFDRITDDFKNGHINLKGICSRCKSWHDELCDVSGQVAIEKHIKQIQALKPKDLEELRKTLLAFQEQVAQLGLSANYQKVVNGVISAAIIEADEDKPAISKIKEGFESALDTIKKAGKTVQETSALYEPAKKIAQLVGMDHSTLRN